MAVEVLPPTPPIANIQAEAGLLGAMMMANGLVDQIADTVVADDFFEPIHGRIFSAIVKEHSHGRVANPVTLRPYFLDDAPMRDIGGAGYLAQLTGSGATVLDARGMAAQVVELARRRALLERLAEITNNASNWEKPFVELVSEAEAAIMDAARASDDGTVERSLADAMAAALEGDAHEAGITCGIEAIDKALGPIHPKEMVVVAGRPGMGKAQPLNAKVLTPSGWSMMGDLSVGDELASIDGEASRVTGIYPQGEKQVFRVLFSDGRSTECCGDHLWQVRYRDWSADRVLSTDKLCEMLARQRYRGRLSVERISGNWGTDENQMPVDPWLLGFLLGDGGLNTGAVYFSTADEEIVRQVEATIHPSLNVFRQNGPGCNYRITTGKVGGDISVRVRNELLDALHELGLMGCRSEQKFVPPRYMRASRATRLALFRGIMDSDGWAEKHGSIRCLSTSERLAYDICELVRSLGGVCSVRRRTVSFTYKGEKRVGRDGFTCRIRMDRPEEAFTLERKRVRCGRIKNTVRLNVRSIEPIRTAECQCISVSHPSRLYVTDDFIVTHNSIVGMSYALGVTRAHESLALDERRDAVLVISLEMSATQLGQRAAADLCFDGHRGIYYGNIVDRKLSDEQAREIARAVDRMREIPLQIIDAPRMTISRLGTTIRRWKRRFAARGKCLRLVVIDYLQLLQPDTREKDLYTRITEVSKGVKAAAKANDVAVIALAQLSRNVEQRPGDHRPNLGDLRDSGQIEQDADGVMFLYRAEYYLKKDERADEAHPKHEAWAVALESVRGQIEYIVAKRRERPECVTKGRFHGSFQAVR